MVDGTLPAVEPGAYGRKQLGSVSRIVAWSHGQRFGLARELARPFEGGHLLDYGCGDGTFVASLAGRFTRIVGADADEPQTRDCATRLGQLPGLSFELTQSLGHSFDRSFDVVFCMEVLEHCLPTDVEAVLSDLRRLAKSAGTIVISVPIEVGPTLLGKHLVRSVLGRRQIGDYQYNEGYSIKELARMVLANKHTAIERPVYGSESGRPYTSHKGFNWRALRTQLESKVVVDRLLFSPLGWTQGLASSQAWFTCINKAPR